VTSRVRAAEGLLAGGLHARWIRTEKSMFGGVGTGLYQCLGDLASSLVQSSCEPAEAIHSTQHRGFMLPDLRQPG